MSASSGMARATSCAHSNDRVAIARMSGSKS
jgi:hypothetical protein